MVILWLAVYLPDYVDSEVIPVLALSLATILFNIQQYYVLSVYTYRY